MTIERYPEPIANFEAWYGKVCRRISTAASRDEALAALEYVRAYHAAKWILPSRLDHAERLLERRCGPLHRPSRKDQAAGDAR